MHARTDLSDAFPFRLLLVAAALTVATFAVVTARAGAYYREFRQFTEFDITLTRLSGEILLHDEALTQSARLGAVTGDPQWRTRYDTLDTLLELRFEELRRVAAIVGYELPTISHTEEANRILVALERRAFELAAVGDEAGALALLRSPRYDALKAEYARGVGEASETVAEILRSRTDDARRGRDAAFAVLAVWLLGLAAVWASLARSVRRWRMSIEAAQQERDAANAELHARVADLARANMELEAVTRAAAHDLREPVRAVHSFAQLVEEEGGLSPEQAAHLARIRKAGVWMGSLIADLAAYTHVGVAARSCELFRLDALVEDLREGALASRFAETNAALHFEGVCEIASDRRVVAKILQNLIDNALQFSGPAPPVVAVSCQEEPFGYLLAVRDNGIGIDPAFHDEIFQLFSRLSRSVGNGTGVGLAVVKKSAESLGGSVEVHSQPGAGAEFRVRLPRTKAHTDAGMTTAPSQ